MRNTIALGSWPWEFSLSNQYEIHCVLLEIVAEKNKARTLENIDLVNFYYGNSTSRTNFFSVIVNEAVKLLLARENAKGMSYIVIK